MSRHVPFTSHRIAFLVILALTGHSFAQFQETVIYTFLGVPDGSRPTATLIHDSAGNLYGTTATGGISTFCCGTVFELSPPASAGGAWTETTLYSFAGENDGEQPVGTLLFDQAGNLYGTTALGGPSSDGTVFELQPPSTPGGVWTKTTLLNFNGMNGSLPQGKLVMDAAENLYGTAASGGTHKKGIVFELVAPKTSGAARPERILYDFGAVAKDGIGPRGDLLLRGGFLYGTAGGGSANQGMIFRLARQPGLWSETILHSFTGDEGENPRGGLIMDRAGNLFGTAQGDNTSVCNTPTACGTVYELSPPAVAGDPWQENTFFRFSSLATGADPYAGLWLNSDTGALFGTTIYGGLGGRNLGTVFALIPPAAAGGAWTESVQHYFRGPAKADGLHPTGALILENGVFYGTAGGNGIGNGVIFSLSR